MCMVTTNRKSDHNRTCFHSSQLPLLDYNVYIDHYTFILWCIKCETNFDY